MVLSSDPTQIAPAGEGWAIHKVQTFRLGFFHIDKAEVRTAEGALDFFVAIAQTVKIALVELHAKATTRRSGGFFSHLIAAEPQKVHTVLTN